MRALLALVGLITGCSTFERDWRAAASKAPQPAEPILGRWDGEWRSDVSGHHGRLRAIVTPGEGGQYLARYRARWACCFSFEYTVPVSAQKSGERHLFQGSADLGRLAGGVYHYDGSATSGEFTSSYRSRSDHGWFRMGRPGG